MLHLASILTQIFEDSEDYFRFLDIVQECREVCGFELFADPHEGFMGHALKIPCLVFLFPVAVVDLFINGGYR